MKYLQPVFILVIFMSISPAIQAQENRGFSLSGLFKFNKAEEKDKYVPIEEEKEPAVVLQGNAGPAMPAVPAGSIKKEVIVKSSLPPPTPNKPQELKALPPVTVEYHPKIPFTTLIFQNGYQENLEPSHLEMLKASLSEARDGHYRGKIQIKSFSDRGRESAIDRAQKVRKYLLDQGISITDLDVQAFPTQTQGNTIHLFLLGEG